MIENMTIFPISTPRPLNPSLKVLFSSATPSSDIDKSVLPLRSLRSILVPGDVRLDFCAVTENGFGLPEVYNKVLSENSESYDIIVFAHDDLIVNDCMVLEKLADARRDGIDLLGVAGGMGWMFPVGADPFKTPIGWTTASRECGMAGMMAHVGDDGRVFSTSYGPCPSRTLTVDGCFMALMNGGLGLRFDTRFKFDFYDMDISFQSHVKGLKTAVHPILCTHMSQGKGVLSPKFLESQKSFLEKWFN